MIRKRYICLLLAMVILPSLIFTSCKKTLGPTKVEVEDSVRHYLPVVIGDDVRMIWEVKNVGNESLMITDVQPSNGSIEFKSIETGLIPPGSSVKLLFIFHSTKNVGYAEHKIRIFGNIEPNGVKEMRFDIHIVRPTLDRTDYEEIYFDADHSVEDESFNKGQLNRAYYTDEDSTSYIEVSADPAGADENDDYRTIRERYRRGEKIEKKKPEKTITLDDGTRLSNTDNEYKDVLQYRIRETSVSNENFIDEIVIWYNNHPGKTVKVKGYSDSETGNSRLNKQLSDERVRTIVDMLTRKGIPANKIKSSSYGDTVQPFAESERNRCVIVEME